VTIQPTPYEKTRFLFRGYVHAQEMKFKEVREELEKEFKEIKNERMFY
jgi:hypothetical protein